MQNKAQSFVDDSLSIYLDIARFLAAISVVLSHMDIDGLYASWLPLSGLSHESVVYFFVLSGLVISNSVIQRERDYRSYVVARTSRIYSVVVPAIALSFLVKGLAAYIEGGDLLNEFISQDLKILNVVGSLLFINESWSMPSELPWNNPFWSLCYEVWFYVLFGSMVFLQGRRRTLVVAIGALIAGPSILVLLPVWLLGVWLAKSGKDFVPRVALAVPLWVLSLAVIMVISDTNFDVTVRMLLHDNVPGYWRLESAQRFPTDYLVGLCVVVNILAFKGFSHRLESWLDRIKRPATYLAGYTFSIYLFHRPFTTALGHFFPNADQNHALSLVYLLAVVVCCMLLGSITEHKRELLARPLRHLLGIRKECRSAAV